MRSLLLYYIFSREDFFRSIQSKYLYDASLIFGIITTSFVIGIYVFLYNKKRRFYRTEAVTVLLNEAITNVLISDENETTNYFTNPYLLSYLLEEENRKFVIERLVNIQKNLIGEASDKIPGLYTKLGLKSDSLKKFKSKIWYKKAKGVYELYMMDQKDMVDEIYKFTNDKNEYLRMEAQTASIHFLGFKGLDFLNHLTQPLHQWQQLKILEQLKPMDPTGFENMGIWLESSNDYVVLFALKIAEIYQQYSFLNEITVCIHSKNEKIRYQAIQTLSRLDIGNSAEALKRIYENETLKNKEIILKELAIIGSENDVDFLQDKMYEQQDNLKLNAIRALVKCSSNGWVLADNLAQKDEVLMSIVNQVKYEHRHELA